MCSQDLLQPGHIVKERWKVVKKIGSGGFGEIYKCIEIASDKMVALKLEKNDSQRHFLKMEVTVLKALQGKDHVCRFLGCGRNLRFNYMVMALQGCNLSELKRHSPTGSFSLSTTLRIGLQILQAVHDLHKAGFLHRDIKPANFAMGGSIENRRNVIMLDFGLARQYSSASGEMRSPREAAGFRGTVRYASINAHKNREVGRHDDLWSLFYMLAEFSHGQLPWKNVKERDQVCLMKEQSDNRHLIRLFPSDFTMFLDHLTHLGYYDTPDYELLASVFERCMSRRAVKFNDPYDWEKPNEDGLNGRAPDHLTTVTLSSNINEPMPTANTCVQRDRVPQCVHERLQPANYGCPCSYGFPKLNYKDLKIHQTAETSLENRFPHKVALAADHFDANDEKNTPNESDLKAKNKQVDHDMHCVNNSCNYDIESKPKCNDGNYHALEILPNVQIDNNNCHLQSPSSTEKDYDVNISIPKEQCGAFLSPILKFQNKDLTVTQFAVADDNVSADQQFTRGGGPALTLVSKWQYSFDDSEDIDPGVGKKGCLSSQANFDKSNLVAQKLVNGLPATLNLNETKTQLFSSKGNFKMHNKEAYRVTDLQGKRRRPVRRSISQPAKTPPNVTVRNIPNKDDLRPGFLHMSDIPFNNCTAQGLPRCWSCPTISIHIRAHLQPPLKQQASFDENVYEVDVMRNVAAKQKVDEGLAFPPDERRTSLPHISVADTHSKEDTKIKNELFDIPFSKNVDIIDNYSNKVSNHGIIGDSPKAENDADSVKSTKISSYQKGILKKNASDKFISLQNTNDIKLQRSLSGPYDRWQENEISTVIHNSQFLQKSHAILHNSDQVNLYQSNIKNGKTVMSNNHNEDSKERCKNVVITDDRKGFVNEDIAQDKSTSLFKKSKSGSAINNKSPSLNATLINGLSSKPGINGLIEKPLKNGCYNLGKSYSSKDLKCLLNGINGCKTIVNKFLQSEKCENDLNCLRQTANQVGSSCVISNKKTVTENLIAAEDCQPSRIPVRYLFTKVPNEDSLHDVKKPVRNSLDQADRRQSDSTTLLTETNSISHLSEEGNPNVLICKKESDVKHENKLGNPVESHEKPVVQRRRRENPDCKYVKDESELKLNFFRRRQRPISITSFSRIPRPCNNTQLSDLNNSVSEDKSDGIHSSCDKDSLLDKKGHELILQRVCSMPSVPLIVDKKFPLYFQDQNISGMVSYELPQPPPGDPPPNHCLPSRRIRYQGPGLKKKEMLLC